MVRGPDLKAYVSCARIYSSRWLSYLEYRAYMYHDTVYV